MGDDRAAPGPKQFSASDCRSVRPSTVYSSNDVKFERNLFSVCGCSNSDMEHFLEHLCGWKYTYARRFCSDMDHFCSLVIHDRKITRADPIRKDHSAISVTQLKLIRQ